MLKAHQRSRKRKGSRRAVWIAWLFLAVGLGLGVGAVVSFTDTIAFMRSALTAPGKVIELERRSCGSKDRSTCYAPRVLFTVPATGRQIEFLSRAATNPPAFRVGEQVVVLYSPENPETAMVQGFFSIWGGVIILSGICAVFAAVGAGILLFPDKVGDGSIHPSLTCTSSGDVSKDSTDSAPSEAAGMHSAGFVSSDAEVDLAGV